LELQGLPICLLSAAVVDHLAVVLLVEGVAAVLLNHLNTFRLALTP
jgi:hypothetical protein